MRLTVKYRGFVLFVQADSFWARLISSSGQPDEECEFKIDVASPDEQKLIVPGAGFTYVIEQHLHFDPPTTYSAEEIEAARKKAEEWASMLGPAKPPEPKNDKPK